MLNDRHVLGKLGWCSKQSHIIFSKNVTNLMNRLSKQCLLNDPNKSQNFLQWQHIDRLWNDIFGACGIDTNNKHTYTQNIMKIIMMKRSRATGPDKKKYMKYPFVVIFCIKMPLIFVKILKWDKRGSIGVRKKWIFCLVSILFIGNIFVFFITEIYMFS